jgi:hypothetical protein
VCLCFYICHEVIIQRNHNTFSSADTLTGRGKNLTCDASASFCVSIYVATLSNRHYKFNTRSQTIQQTLASSFYSGIKNYSRDVLLLSKTQTNEQIEIDVCAPSGPGDADGCFSGRCSGTCCVATFLLPGKASNTHNNRRESNWLWHENRIIIIHFSPPLYQNRFMNMSNICASNK